jgi:septum formation protein
MDIGSVYKKKIILASGSPRRRQLLEDAGFQFSVHPVNVEEDFPAQLKAEQIVLFLAEKKAAAFPELLLENEILLTADTIVWVNDIVLNKPSSEFEAKQMLQLLSGKTHQVFTGVCLRTKEKQISFFDETKVHFKNLSEEEILFYIKNYKPFDKAGSYGAQDWLGLIGVDRIDGSYFNVMGLPVYRVYEELRKL